MRIRDGGRAFLYSLAQRKIWKYIHNHYFALLTIFWHRELLSGTMMGGSNTERIAGNAENDREEEGWEDVWAAIDSKRKKIVDSSCYIFALHYYLHSVSEPKQHKHCVNIIYYFIQNVILYGRRSLALFCHLSMWFNGIFSQNFLKKC